MSSPSTLLALSLVTPGLALGTTAAMPGDEVFSVSRKSYEAGEQLRFQTRVELQLTATVLLGFLAQQVSYELLEEETLELQLSAADDGGELSQRVSYPLARRTTVAPLVGERVKDRRVSGKSYLVRRTGDELTVFDAGGAPSREKEAREVRRSCFTVGSEPALFALLPATELEAGAVLQAEGDAAKRLLGLGLDELQADSLQLILRGAGAADELLFDANASLSGEAELGGRRLTLNAQLAGLLVADRTSGRMLRLELSGPLDVGSQGAEAEHNAAGSGTLTIRRDVGRGD